MPFVSVTAERAARQRAAHQVFGEPPVFEDPLALTIIDPAAAQALRKARRDGSSSRRRRLRAFIAVRSRIAEALLARRRAGFGDVRDYAPPGIHAEFFSGRADCLTIGKIGHMAYGRRM